MKKKSYLALLAVLAFLLGLVATLQLKQFRSSFKSNSADADVIANQQRFRQLQEENENLKSTLSEYKSQLDQIHEKFSKSDKNFDYLQVEIDQYKMLGGFTDLVGEGIVVSFSAPVNKEVSLGHFYQQLVTLVNELNSSGAEAVSINNERIIGTTEIRLAGNAVVINGKENFSPFLIQAIGDRDTLHNALTSRFGFVENIRNYGYNIEIKKQSDIVVKKYDGRPTFHYAHPYEE